jgi:hypothetical protein
MCFLHVCTIYSAKMHVYKDYPDRNRILIEFLGDIQGEGGIYANYTGITMKPKRVRAAIYSDQSQVCLTQVFSINLNNELEYYLRN